MGEQSLELFVTTLTLSDGTTLGVPTDGIIVLVGPNNVGKSVALRDISSHLVNPNPPTRVITGVQFHKAGDGDALTAWIEEHCQKSRQGPVTYSRMGQGNRNIETLQAWWSGGPPFQDLGQMLMFYGGAEHRLAATQPASSADFATQAPTHPLHHLYLDTELEKEVSGISVRAFGVGLAVNRYGGSMIHLHVGAPPPAEHGTDAPSAAFLDSFKQMPLLQEQGDGMRSFIGLLLNLAVAEYFMVLIDEPEAFLHPPQEQLLGRTLGEKKGPKSQVFVATHSSNVLRGLLDSPAKDVTIIRLVRDGNINHSAQLDAKDVRRLWKDPLLRHSNILDGLFHQAVVLCESDTDCRFYAGVLESALQEKEEATRPELLFTHCGGKDRMPMVINALRAVSVPVRVVADFDVLRDEPLLKRVVSAFGADWSTLKPNWTRVKSALDAESKAPQRHYVQAQMTKLLDATTGASLDESTLEKARQLLKWESGWEKAKRSGLSAVPQGEAHDACKKLLQSLNSIGLFVVEVGEVERFIPEVGGHGPAWINSVFEKSLQESASATAAKAFILMIVQSAIG